MQGFSDFADGQESAGSRLFDFQRLFAVCLKQPDQSVQYRQRNWRRLAFGCLQGFDYFGGFLGIGHVGRLANGTLLRNRSGGFAEGGAIWNWRFSDPTGRADDVSSSIAGHLCFDPRSRLCDGRLYHTQAANGDDACHPESPFDKQFTMFILGPFASAWSAQHIQI
jgi:hypothetical protein